MKTVQYVNDSKGRTNFVMVPFNEWNKMNKKIEEYETELKVKKSLSAGINDIFSNRKKKDINVFLNEL